MHVPDIRSLIVRRCFALQMIFPMHLYCILGTSLIYFFKSFNDTPHSCSHMNLASSTLSVVEPFASATFTDQLTIDSNISSMISAKTSAALSSISSLNESATIVFIRSADIDDISPRECEKQHTNNTILVDIDILEVVFGHTLQKRPKRERHGSPNPMQA